MAHEGIQRVLAMFQDEPESADIVATRRGYERAISKHFPVPSGVVVQPIDAGGVPAEWIVATQADPTRAVLYLHGGGYVYGSCATHREFGARLSLAAHAAVLLLDYRLAPEHTFPAPVEDGLAAYRWLLERGLASKHIVIAGESAGGGLTVALLVALRDAGDSLPAAGICISPWVDMQALGESMTTRAAVDPVVQKDSLLELARLYLGDADARSPLAAPLYADLAGLPALLVMVGDHETLLDDALRLTAHARAAGIEVEYECWAEMIHNWPLYAAHLAEGQQALDRIGGFVRERTG